MKIFFCLLISMAFNTIAPEYKIIGTVSGLPDGTWLYLRSATPDRDIDSCTVTNGHFSMSGRISEKATQVYLHTARYTNYVAFWLENTAIRINLKSGEFKKGSITGSATQDEEKQLNDLKGQLTQQTDSLESAIRSTTDSLSRQSLIDERAKLERKEAQLERDYVRAHPISLVSANLLNIYATTWGRDTVISLYRNMSAEIKTSRYGREINEYIKWNRPIAAGGSYADFEQANTQGKMIKLSAIKGKYVLLDFWASWCGPCREENPNLVKTYEQFKNKGFAILGVSLDDNKTYWLKAVTDDKLSWENVCDLHGGKNRAALLYGISAIPNNFLIDEKGIIVAKNLRGKELDDKLRELLP